MENGSHTFYTYNLRYNLLVNWSHYKWGQLLWDHCSWALQLIVPRASEWTLFYWFSLQPYFEGLQSVERFWMHIGSKVGQQRTNSQNTQHLPVVTCFYRFHWNAICHSPTFSRDILYVTATLLRWPSALPFITATSTRFKSLEPNRALFQILDRSRVGKNLGISVILFLSSIDLQETEKTILFSPLQISFTCIGMGVRVCRF